MHFIYLMITVSKTVIYSGPVSLKPHLYCDIISMHDKLISYFCIAEYIPII